MLKGCSRVWQNQVCEEAVFKCIVYKSIDSVCLKCLGEFRRMWSLIYHSCVYSFCVYVCLLTKQGSGVEGYEILCVFVWEEFRIENVHSSVYSFVHSLIRVFIRSFTHPCIHPCIDSFIHSSVYSFVHSLIRVFICSFTHPCIHLFIHSSVYSFVHSLIRVLIRSFTHPCIHSFIQFIFKMTEAARLKDRKHVYWIR